jgi:putative membrane protein
VGAFVATALVIVVALLHVYFLILEMFLWDKPFGQRVFRLTPEFAAASKALAANQGLYNGFLATGLFYGVATAQREIELLFLAFVIVAGLFGAATVNRQIFWIQAAPALAAAVLLVVQR